MKHLAVILSLFLALQSCVVYNKSFISMDEAIKMEKKQKVMLADPESEDYWDNKMVTMHGDTLYGSNIPNNSVTGYKNNGKYATPIPEQYRSYQVHLKNIEKSREATAMLLALPIPIFGLIALMAIRSFSVDL